MKNIEDFCKRKGIEFVPHTDPRVKRFRRKLRRRLKYKFFYGVKLHLTLYFLEIRDFIKGK